LQKQLSLEESPYPRPIVLADNGDEAGDVVIGPVISGGASLNQLSQELVKQNIKATRIAFWSAENQEWVQFELPRPELKFDNPYEIIRTFDRFIRPDEGFFLLCEQNGLYIPFLNWNEKPPVPPFPPKPPFEERVSYTGKLDMVCGIPENMPPYEFAIFPYNEKKAISLMTTTDDVKAQLSAIYQAEDLCTVEGVMKHIRWGGYWPGESSHEEDVLMVNTVKKVYSMDPVMAELKAREYLAGLLGVDQGEITIVGSYDATIQKDGEIERRIVGVAIRVVTLKYNEREYLVKTTCAIYPGAEWGSFQVLLFL
ncbi:MAG: hypothetical protein KKD29_00950, partial [Candidatus Omnitrophica bacterium]|nr:hypothetical protein [Candidatus Omnitrophota bacterium]